MEDDDKFLFQVDFVLYPHPEIEPKVNEVFDREIDKWNWAMFQNGQIIKRHIDGLSEKRWVIDLDDEETLINMKILPTLFSFVDKQEKKTWRLNVYDQDSGERDYIIRIKGEFFLKYYNEVWDAISRDMNQLMKDIKNLRDKI